MLIRLAVGAIVAAAIGLSSWQLAGPQGNVELSRETTYVTAPLAADGLPNFALAIIEHQRDGVTAENNGARLFWQAMGPVDMSPEQYLVLCRELAIEPATNLNVTGINSREMVNRFAEWLAAQRTSKEPSGAPLDESTSDALQQAAQDGIDRIMGQPWRSQEAPPVAAQLAEDRLALDLLVEAAAHPRFFSPSPDVLADAETPVLNMSLPHVQAARQAVRSLAARAMNRVAQRQYEAAWRDTLACWRYGALIGEGPTLIDGLVGIAIRGVAMKSTLALLQSDDLPEPLVRQILGDLNAQPSAIDMTSMMGFGERLMYVDSALRQITGRLGGLDLLENGVITSIISTVDPNVPLRMGNQWYDRLAIAAALADRAARVKAIEQFEADLKAFVVHARGQSLWRLMSRDDRSEAVGEAMIALMLPATSAAMAASDRDCTALAAARIAAALAVFRVQSDSYPITLDELGPAILAQLPLDPYSNKSFIYRRRDDGYLLYSVFQNGVDDGGSDFGGEIVQGEWVAGDDELGADLDHTDFVIRMPRPWPPLFPATDAP